MGILGKMLGLAAKKQPVHITDDNFLQEVAGSDTPVLVDVWGANCGPCKKLEPVIMELAAQYDGRVKVCEMQAQQTPVACTKLYVRATPTVLYFKGGKELERITGYRSSLYHQQTIEELFGIPK